MFKKILVALSEHELDSFVNTPVFETLDGFLLEQDTTVILSHVVPVTASELDRGMDQHHESESLLQEKIQQVQSKLQNLLMAALDFEVVSGEPGEEIVRLANIHQTELIILGSRDLRGVSRVLNQSVSSQVCEEAPCSVLVVKSGQR
ncbi:MAG: universal stress protein [Cyanobacteria bacterium P01_F01_bin.42]